MVAVWAVAPASFVLSMVYSEALFCALAIWSLVALVERRWLMAGVLTIGAGVARSSTGVALVAAHGLCSLTERFPWSVHVYTLAIVVIALGVGPLYLGSKPRFLLPAVLLSVPVARLLAPLPAWLLGLVIGVLGAASVWFSLFMMTAGWPP